MGFSVDKLTRPLPPWIENIKRDAHRKIVCSNFAVPCRQGNVAVVRQLIIGLWPFVDTFPKILIHGSRHLRGTDFFEHREVLKQLIHRSSGILLGIQRDVKNHRKLWLETGKSLGLNYPGDFDRAPIPEVVAWIDEVAQEDSDPFRMFLRFAAIEMIAESVSVDFLASNHFTFVLNLEGCEWFRVHAVHEPGVAHEDLELRLAFAFTNNKPTRAESNSVIQTVVDLFINAADACARLAMEKATAFSDFRG